MCRNTVWWKFWQRTNIMFYAINKLMSLDPEIKIHTANYSIFMLVTVKPVILSQTGAKTDNKSLLFRLTNISYSDTQSPFYILPICFESDENRLAPHFIICLLMASSESRSRRSSSQQLLSVRHWCLHTGRWSGLFCLLLQICHQILSSLPPFSILNLTETHSMWFCCYVTLKQNKTKNVNSVGSWELFQHC